MNHSCSHDPRLLMMPAAPAARPSAARPFPWGVNTVKRERLYALIPVNGIHTREEALHMRLHYSL